MVVSTNFDCKDKEKVPFGKLLSQKDAFFHHYCTNYTPKKLLHALLILIDAVDKLTTLEALQPQLTAVNKDDIQVGTEEHLLLTLCDATHGKKLRFLETVDFQRVLRGSQV